jgi:hypothetical protein
MDMDQTDAIWRRIALAAWPLWPSATICCTPDFEWRTSKTGG